MQSRTSAAGCRAPHPQTPHTYLATSTCSADGRRGRGEGHRAVVLLPGQPARRQGWAVPGADGGRHEAARPDVGAGRPRARGAGAHGAAHRDGRDGRGRRQGRRRRRARLVVGGDGARDQGGLYQDPLRSRRRRRDDRGEHAAAPGVQPRRVARHLGRRDHQAVDPAQRHDALVVASQRGDRRRRRHAKVECVAPPPPRPRPTPLSDPGKQAYDGCWLHRLANHVSESRPLTAPRVLRPLRAQS